MSILVVEDNALNLELIRVVLEIDGHVVEAARSGAELRARMMTPPPEVVLMDILLPDDDGENLLRAMRLVPGWQAVPVLAVTAQALIGDAERFLAAGFDEVVTKPIDTRALGAVVAKYRSA